MTDDAAIRVEAVTKRYGRTLALDDVSFAFGAHGIFALLGPNGAGKSTLLQILSTILRPDSGAAFVAGVDVVKRPQLARERLGIVFQEPSLDDRLTVYENLNLHGMVFGVPSRFRRRRIERMLALVELSDWAEKPTRTLSSGMKRRLEIARALIHDTNVLLLDEPTVGLDTQTRERIWGYLRELQRERRLCILVTTHYIEEVETCDRLCVIDQGRILVDDTPEALKRIHGQRLLRVAPRRAEDHAAISARYADRIVRAGPDEIVLRSDGEAFDEAFLGESGARLRALVLETPSLESVFLTLTGRDLRDQEASPRERTRAFGRRGGEHTR